MFINVALKIRTEKLFSYSVPEKLQPLAAVGKRVLVPLGGRKAIGCVLEISDSSPIANTREIINVLDPEPLFGTRDLEFYRWAAEYYFYSCGKLVTEIIPGGDGVSADKHVSLTRVERQPDLLSPEQARVVELLETKRGITLKKLKDSGFTNLKELLGGLEQLGYISIEEKVKVSAARSRTEKMVEALVGAPEHLKLSEAEAEILSFLRESGPATLSGLKARFGSVLSVIRKLEKKNAVKLADSGIIPFPQPAEFREPLSRITSLTDEQSAALGEIKAALSRGVFSPFLLHGVTGSGKTEVYLAAMEEALKNGGSAIYLVPEISLTPQLLARVYSRFPGVPVAVLHSSIPEAARFDQWVLIRRGDARIIVGARSAVFAPCPDLKLLIVDEEHDPSYKQEDRMRYNARDLAILRAQQNSATIVLGSATPGIHSFRAARSGRLEYLPLTKRVEGRTFPSMDLVDMREEKDEKGRVPALSARLRKAIGETLETGGQALIFLNRRGFNTFINCRNCGYVFKCRNCSVSLVLHAAEKKLKCHYCNYSETNPGKCPQCGGNGLVKSGAGTERLEQELSALFPSARVGRMDRDTTSRKGSHAKILNSFANREIDILVGTQMIAKGHDYPNIHLVGVVSVDNTLNMPDFRAAERCFQLLTQVSGRGGRGDVPGRVIVQTFNPGHHSIIQSMENDYEGFYTEEIKLRRELGYPPFSRLIGLEITSLNRDRAVQGAESLGKAAGEICRREGRAGISALGPVEAPISKVKNRYRWKMLVKGANVSTLHEAVRELLSRVPEKGFEIRVDVDPVNFL